jgi:chromosome segregation ATPase
MFGVVIVQTDRSRKNAEAELHDVSTRVNELAVTVTSLTGDKRRLEAEIAALQAELEEALSGRRAAEERADRAQAELGRLADELRQVFYTPACDEGLDNNLLHNACFNSSCWRLHNSPQYILQACDMK